jgi:hypothetical protein
MSSRDDVYAYLDEHQPDLSTRSYANVADELMEHFDLARRTLRRYVGDWEKSDETDDGETSGDEPEAPDQSHGLDLLQRDYHYNEADDVYLVFVDHRPENLIIPGEKARSIKRSYSNWTGDQSSINEICRTHGINRRDFVAIKRAFGWTHDSAPLTDEELVDRPIDAQVEDLARERERDLERRWQKRKYRETEEDARKWRQWSRETAKPLIERVKATPTDEHATDYATDSLDDWVLVPHVTDAHLDQMNPDGSGIEENRQRWLGALAENLKRAQQLGRPRRIALTLGSDQFNIDTQKATTTNGTPQQQSSGTRRSMYEAADAGVEAIELCREVAPVDVRVVPGNHDRRTAELYYWALQRKYSEIDDIDVQGGASEMQFCRYGQNLLGWTHGDRVKGGETKRNEWLSAQLLHGATDLVSGASHFFVLLGHLHYVAEKDSGVHTLQGGSTAPVDEWHRREGYTTSKKCQTAYVFDDAGGQRVRLTAYVD